MYLAALLGFVLLFGGGEGLVHGAVAVARRFGLSSLLIGLTIVAAGTSAPELLVSVSAAAQGNADIAIGNVVGSNIFNVLGVLGVSALIAPIVVKPAEVKRDTLVMVAAMIAVAVAAQFGVIGWPVGLAFIAAIIGYTVYSYRTELREKPAPPSTELHEREGEEFAGPSSLWLALIYIALGFGALVIGSQLLISGATGIARTLGVPEAVIGLTLVAIGTSLPELATGIAAALRGHSDVAVGNVVGSNIFNGLLIIGATASICPINVAESVARLDVWVMVAVAIVLIPLLIGRGRIGRLAGALFTASYIIYAVTLLV